MLATFTVTPALSAIILPSHIHETETRIVKFIERLYLPVLIWALANRKIIMAGAPGPVLMTIMFARVLGVGFLPKLEGGKFWVRGTLPPTHSPQEGNAHVNEKRKIIRKPPAGEWEGLEPG